MRRDTKHPCPVCGSGGALQATWRPEQRRWLLNCHACPEGGGEWLRAAASALGTSALILLDRPLDFLGPPVAAGGSGRGPRRGEPLPDMTAARRALRGRAGREARGWLAARGIPFAVARRYGLGWSASHGALVLPLRRGAELVNVRARAPAPGENMRGWPGRRAEDGAYPLFPEPEPADRWTLLVEGELDALAGRAAGLPSCSVTLGVGTWRDEWTALLAERGRPVAVLFDADEQAQAHAEDRAARLRAAGVRAARLDPARLGLTARGADLTDYLAAGGTARTLREEARRCVLAGRTCESQGYPQGSGESGVGGRYADRPESEGPARRTRVAGRAGRRSHQSPPPQRAESRQT